MRRVLIEYNKNSSFADVQYGIELWRGWADQAIVAFHPDVMEQAKKLIDQYDNFILPGIKAQGIIEQGHKVDELVFWNKLYYEYMQRLRLDGPKYIDCEWPFRDYSDHDKENQYPLNFYSLSHGLEPFDEETIFFPGIQTPPTQRENQIPLIDAMYKMTGGKFVSDAHSTPNRHLEITKNTPGDVTDSHKAMLDIMPQDKIIYLMWVQGNDQGKWRNHQLKMISDNFKFDMIIHPGWGEVDGFPNFITLGKIADSL